jgi:hypothetical protein
MECAVADSSKIGPFLWIRKTFPEVDMASNDFFTQQGSSGCAPFRQRSQRPVRDRGIEAAASPLRAMVLGG